MVLRGSVAKFFVGAVIHWNRSVREAMDSINTPGFGVYIHIPFCRTKCNYCTFVIKPWRKDLAERYSRAVIQELDLFLSENEVSGVADTIYFGGGTPSLVPAEHIAALLSTCRRHFDVPQNCEISLEANPGTVTAEKAAAYRGCGITRISLGAQTFDERSLQAIGRDHTAGQVATSLALLREKGFENINVDLILGLPEQDEIQWAGNLEMVTQLEPPHISVYMLELEPKSPLYHLVARGVHRVPDEDAVSDWYLGALDHLPGHGYAQYEISNFALPGYECRHNLKYWQRRPVFGFGIGSHSFDGRARYANLAGMNAYLSRVEAGISPVEWRRVLDEKEELGETLFLGLRLRSGLNWEELSEGFGAEQVAEYEKTLRSMSNDGLVEWRDSSIRLTPRGMLLSNEVFQAFV